MNAVASISPMPSYLLQAAALVVAGGTLLDGSGAAIDDAVVVIRGGKIAAIGRRSEMKIPAGAKVVDAAGWWIVPGFIDNHVHVGNLSHQPRFPLAPRSGERMVGGRVRGAPALDAWTRTGVTTLVDNGSSVPLRILRKRDHGIVACGRIITARGGYPAVGVRESPALEVDSVAEVERYLDAERPDCVKIAIERGFLADYDDAGWPTLTRAQVRAIVTAAHARKLSVRAHVTQPGELAVAIESGVDVIAHTPIASVPDALLREAAKAGVILVSTVALWKDAKLSGIAAENLARYVRMGGRIAIGSDYPNWPEAGLPMEELRLLARAGIPPRTLLSALTVDGAAALRRPDLGKIASGARADLVVLSADPRQSVEAFGRVRIVIRGGVLVLP